MQRTVFPLAIIVLIAFGAYTAFAPESGSLNADQSTHFAVSDTALVQKIRIADKQRAGGRRQKGARSSPRTVVLK